MRTRRSSNWELYRLLSYFGLYAVGPSMLVVAKLIGEGVERPIVFCFTLGVLQLVTLAFASFALQRLSLRTLILAVSSFAIAWGVAVPGVRRSVETQRLRAVLSTTATNVDYGNDPGYVTVWLPNWWRVQICLRVPVSVYLVDVSDTDICKAAKELAKYQFDGKLDIETYECGDGCLEEISKIRPLRHLSISARKGPTNSGLNSALARLQLVSLALRVRCSVLNNHPHSLSSRALVTAYESQGISWAVDDEGLRNIGGTSRISICGLPVSGRFLKHHSAPDDLHSLTFHSTLIGSEDVDWLGEFTILWLLDVIGSPIGDRFLSEMSRLKKLVWVRLNSSLISDRGARALLDYQADQFTYLCLHADLNASLADLLRNHFSNPHTDGAVIYAVKHRPLPEQE